MGSLPSPPRMAAPARSPDSSPFNSRVLVSFCHKNISNWIESYNPSTNTWSHVTTIPDLLENHVLKDFAMVAIGESIYVIGGRLCRRDIPPPSDSEEESDEFACVGVGVRSLVLRYNVRLDQWTTCAPLSVARYEFACTVHENKIYVAGGKCNLCCARGISHAEVYDPTHDAWTPLPNMSTLRYKCAGVTWQGKIHVVGGFAVRADADQARPYITERSSAEVYDIRTGKWELVAGMWQLDVPPNQIVALDGKLFSSGDCYKPWKGHIEAYDGKTNIWTVVDGSSYSQVLDATISASDAMTENWPPVRGLYLTVAPIGAQLFFLAGYRMDGDSRTMSVVYMFDTTATGQAWRNFEPMEEERGRELCSHCCVVQIS